LAEYASIVLICILTSILFMGGYLLDYTPLLYILQQIDYSYMFADKLEIFSTPLVEGTLFGLTLGFKSCVMIFIFI